MKGHKVYFCMLVFAFLMGIKCFQQEIADSARAWMSEVLWEGVNYEQLIRTLGSRFADGGLQKELVEALKENLRLDGSGHSAGEDMADGGEYAQTEGVLPEDRTKTVDAQ